MNTMPLPAGPFFCADEGRYLPGLTDLVVLSAAMVQRREIEEELLKLRLKQRCFVALAERAPGALVVRNEELEVRSSEFGKGMNLLEARVGCASENPAAADPANPEGKPESNIGELNSTGGGSRSHSIKVFPLGPVSTKGTDGASRQQCPTGFGVYPKGRW